MASVYTTQINVFMVPFLLSQTCSESDKCYETYSRKKFTQIYFAYKSTSFKKSIYEFHIKTLGIYFDLNNLFPAERGKIQKEARNKEILYP